MRRRKSAHGEAVSVSARCFTLYQREVNVAARFPFRGRPGKAGEGMRPAGPAARCYARALYLATTASPIWLVLTSVPPSDRMSFVRRPSSSTAAIAFSSRSASSTMLKE